MENYKKKNQELIQNDIYVSKKRDAKNAIESYIYTTRSQCNDSKFDSLISSDEKTKIRELLESAENWIYEEGANSELDGLEARLKTLKAKS